MKCFLSLLTLLAFSVPGAALAQTRPGESLDQELLRNLDDPFQERDPQPPAEPASKPKDERRGNIDERLGDDSDPLVNVARRMHDAAALLDKANGGPMTQYLQDEIITDLDAIIKQAKQSAGKQGGTGAQQSVGRTAAGQPKPAGQGGGKSNDQTATGSSNRETSSASRKVDPERLQSLMKRVWGSLPERAREQVLQLPAETFMPQYETLIEDYFRRLSDSNNPPEGRRDER